MLILSQMSFSISFSEEMIGSIDSPFVHKIFKKYQKLKLVKILVYIPIYIGIYENKIVWI